MTTILDGGEAKNLQKNGRFKENRRIRQIKKPDRIGLFVTTSRHDLPSLWFQSRGFAEFLYIIGFFPGEVGEVSAEVAAGRGLGINRPGGSQKEDEVIACADKYGIAMVFTGKRHFTH